MKKILALLFVACTTLFLPTQTFSAELITPSVQCDNGEEGLYCICSTHFPNPGVFTNGISDVYGTITGFESYPDITTYPTTVNKFDKCTEVCLQNLRDSAASNPTAVREIYTNSNNPLDFYATLYCVDASANATNQKTEVIKLDNQLNSEGNAQSANADLLNNQPPRLNIKIPGFGETFTTSNYIGEYIKAIYQFLLGISALIAILMFTIAGFQWMLAAGNSAGIAQAKKRMADTLAGIILLLCAYAIAQLIDPSFTTFERINVSNVARIEDELHFDNESQTTSSENITLPDPSLVAITGPHLQVMTTSRYMDAKVLEALNAAAEQFYEEEELNIRVTSGSRSVQRQVEIFYDQCLTPGKNCLACNPVPSSSPLLQKQNSRYVVGAELQGKSRAEVVAALTAVGRASKCPHTSNIAVDAWCPRGQKTGYITEIYCQEKLIQIMSEHGFCRLGIEAWHFEYNVQPYTKLSTDCSMTPSITYKSKTTGAAITPDKATCSVWDWDDHKCVVAK